MTRDERKKIAVLGGGCGAMSAAWTLTTLPGWEEKYDITLYQMGWRLGGKGACGRNDQYGQRIQEHGLHVWAGFYENAFKVMQDAYAAMPELEGNPIRTWEDAFKKHSAVMLQDEIDGKWVSWPVEFPENDAVPGTGGEFPSVWQYIQLVLNWFGARHGADAAAEPGGCLSGGLLGRIGNLFRNLGGLLGGEVEEVEHELGEALASVLRHATGMPEDPRHHERHHHEGLFALLDRAEEALERHLAKEDDDPQLDRERVLFNLAKATTKGLIEDGVILHGFHHIDDQEWSAWMKRHGATEETLESSIVRGIYDYVFGYHHGDENRRSLAAGVAVHGMFRLAFTYKGALFYEMQAGMGDIVFSPLYLALKERGVKFRFFYKVTNLAVSEDKGRIQRVDFDRQATLKGDDYDPLIRVKGVPVWPAEPRYDQLVQGEELRKDHVDLESSWSPWKGEPVSIEHGTDFDEVILGISIAAYKDVCKELIANNREFRDMTEQVDTVQTAGTQLWLDPSPAELGFPTPPRITTAYAQLLNTWADLTYLIEREDWPAPGPRSLAYFCSQFPDAEVIPPYSDHEFPKRELDRYRAISRAWMEEHIGHIWNKAGREGSPQALDLDLLHDAAGGSGDERFDAQYFRVNVEPTERYVLSRPGTIGYRRRAGDTGYRNLAMAGDWVSTTINAGCVEAAVMAGMDAAAAVSGADIKIVGGWDS